METASQKVTLSYSDKLLRHSKAYEVLLEIEFSFYEKTSKYTADLIVDIQDVCGDLVNNFGKENNQNLVNAKETILRILQGVIIYKRDVLLAQSFIPSEIFNISSKLLEYLQKNAHPLYELLKKANEQSMDEEDNKKTDEILDETLLMCAMLMSKIKSRLTELSN